MRLADGRFAQGPAGKQRTPKKTVPRTTFFAWRSGLPFFVGGIFEARALARARSHRYQLCFALMRGAEAPLSLLLKQFTTAAFGCARTQVPQTCTEEREHAAQHHLPFDCPLPPPFAQRKKERAETCFVLCLFLGPLFPPPPPTSTHPSTPHPPGS